MKRFLVFLVVASMAFAGVALFQKVVHAQESPPMTEAHIERIRANCIEAQTLLSQLHASDALLRVNRGQLYELISTKLMAPMNSRIALNHLDSGGLPGVASDYEQALATFRQDYQQYEEAMSRALRIPCTNQPVAFYDSVTETRNKRTQVHASTLELQRLIQAYQIEFDIFTKRFHEVGQ